MLQEDISKSLELRIHPMGVKTLLVGMCNMVWITVLWCIWANSGEVPSLYRVAVIGDYGCGCEAEDKVTQEIFRQHKAKPFIAVVTVGDNVYGEHYPSPWRFLLPARKKGGHPGLFRDRFDRYFGRLLTLGIEVHATLGNHDVKTAGGRYLIEDSTRFGILGENGYYSFSPQRMKNIRPVVEFFALNSVILSDDPKDPQWLWLRKALSVSQAIWKVIYLHHPLYTPPGRHRALTSVRDVLEPIIRKGNSWIVWQGHNHFYARMKDRDGIYYYVSGNSGAPLHPLGATPLMGCGAERHGFMAWTFTEDTAYFAELGIDGRTLDEGLLRIEHERPKVVWSHCSVSHE